MEFYQRTRTSLKPTESWI